MGRRYDLTNVEETHWLSTVGEHTVKVISVTSGSTRNGNDTEKVLFMDKDKAQITDEFVITDKALYRLKLFTKALKLQDVNDTDQWVGRFVKINTVVEKYTKNDGSQGEKIVIKSYDPSSLATPYVPIEVVHQPKINQVEEIDINDDEIPFNEA